MFLIFTPGTIITVKTPEMVYVWMGFFNSDVVPSPKNQIHSFALPVEVSVNCTVSGAGPLVGVAVKAGTGFWGSSNIWMFFVALVRFP